MPSPLSIWLTPTERKAILDHALTISSVAEKAISQTKKSLPVVLPLQEWEDLAETLLAAANHTDTPRVQLALSRLEEKIAAAIETNEPKAEPSITAKDQANIDATIIACWEWIAAWANTAEQLKIKQNGKLVSYSNLPAIPQPLSQPEREQLAKLNALPLRLRRKLQKVDQPLVWNDLTAICLALLHTSTEPHTKQAMAESGLLGKIVAVLTNQQIAFSLLKQKPAAKPVARPSDQVYQFQIRLLHTKPLIWRRIQTRDMSLAQLHEVIQVAMGWENCHLYAFGIGQDKYGIVDEMEPDLLRDASDVLLSEVLPQNGRRITIGYEYDFGDGWLHQIVFEGCPKADAKGVYPVCLEGEHACPPEDVGGPPGFEEFVEAIKDRDHEQHAGYVEWAGDFDPAFFDLKLVNKSLKKLTKGTMGKRRP